MRIYIITNDREQKVVTSFTVKGPASVIRNEINAGFAASNANMYATTEKPEQPDSSCTQQAAD